MSTSVIQFRNARWSTIGLGVILLLSGVHAAWADPVSTAPAPASSLIRERDPVTHVISPSTKLSMIQLDARILEFSKRVESVDGFNSEIVSVTAESPNRIRLHAETTGVTALTVRDESGAVFTIEVFVEGDVRELRAYLEKLFPNAALEVVSLKDSVVLRGWVTEPDIIPQIMAVAKQMYPTVHNNMRVGGVNQVQLKVKILEVQRSKLKQLGFNFAAAGQNYAVANSVGGIAPLAGLTTPLGGPPIPSYSGTATSGVPLNFAITGNTDTFQGFVDALTTEALAKTLAEPTLTTTSGRPANLLSGGEFPILVPSGLGNVSIQFREFGVRMEAIPTVLGNGRIRLDIAPEVSQRDFSSAVNVNGFVVPGINTRRVNTQVELNCGETVMIGGLISRRRTVSSSKIPIIGELPVIGAAFSKKTNEISETELLIMVTPEFSAAMRSDQVPHHAPGWMQDDPTSKELFMDGMLEVPSYGEPCEECQDGFTESCPVPMQSGQPVYSPDVSSPGPELSQGVSVPAASPPAGEIQTMSGREEGDSRVVPAGGDPFRVPTRKELPVRKTTSTRTTRAPGSTEAPLPGAIQPKSNRSTSQSPSQNAPGARSVRSLIP
jgi:pilus assembly protein CpaC